MISTKELVNNQRAYFYKGETKDIGFRIEKLKVLRKAIMDNEEAILEALKNDLGKVAFEAYETEVGIVLDEIRFTIKNLAKWAKPRRVKTPMMHFLSTSYTYWEPHGVTLIMSPWNYPFQLAMAPLIGSIAGGNCSVIKPSEYSANTSAIICKIIRENFNEEYVAVMEGGRKENSALLEQKFDYIFFTGSVAVGKIVMESAARHLTPVTLELGGKSPCIVDKDANIDIAARRIVWGKFLNAGQTCVAPDYMLVHKSVKKEFITKVKKCIKEFYGENPLNSEDLGKIINEKHFNRLVGLMNGGNIVSGGQYEKERLRIAPTVIDDIALEDNIMQEEIFGPLMPVLEFEDISQVVSLVNGRPKPLALYIFTNNKDVERTILRDVSFGGGCVNDTIVHLATPHMPFGGVGESGMGGYHGIASFQTFSHQKSVLKKSVTVDVKLRYAPYKDNIRLLRKILK